MSTETTQETKTETKTETQNNQPGETEKAYSGGLAEGEKRRNKKLAKELGYEDLDDTTLADLKSAIEERRQRAEKDKTKDQRIAEKEAAEKSLREQVDSLRSTLSATVEAQVKALPEELKKLVTDFAGDDPLARSKYLNSDAFKALAAKLSGGGALGGSLGGAGTQAGGSPNTVLKEAVELHAKAMKGEPGALERYQKLAAKNPGLDALVAKERL